MCSIGVEDTTHVGGERNGQAHRQRVEGAERPVGRRAPDPGPQTLGQVLERLEGDTGWSRTTVHTYLTRMMGKGLVSADEHSPRRYSAAVTLEECAAQEERSLMDRAYGGSAGKLAAAFLRSASLTREERDELRKLLDEMEV